MSQSIVLLVRLGEDFYAIPIGAIEEVLPALPIEAMPRCPAYVRGVIFVRGHLIPVLSAAERLGIINHKPSEDPHIVCIRLGSRLLGIEFDEALDLMDIQGAETLGWEAIGAPDGFFTSVVECKGLVIRMLNPDRLIAPDESRVWKGADLEQLQRSNVM